MASPASDLREWIALLEREGELHRVAVEVDPDLEITEITDRVVKSRGPALLFENVKGSKHKLLINQFGTERRMCLAFAVGRLDDVAEQVTWHDHPPLRQGRDYSQSKKNTSTKLPLGLDTTAGQMGNPAARPRPRPFVSPFYTSDPIRIR